MNKKLMVLKRNKKDNTKEIIYIILDSVYDINRKRSNIYTMKQLMELEKKVKNSDDYTYEFKLIDGEEMETLFLNCDIGDKAKPRTGSIFSFLVAYARHIDEYKNQRPSNIFLADNSYDSLNIWIKKQLNEFKDKNPNKR